MKKVLVILVSIAVIVVLLHLALFVFINVKGRDIIVASFQKTFDQEAQLDSIKLSFPFAVEINNFQSGDISFRRAKISLGLSNPFSHFLVSNLYLEDPEVNVTMDRKGLRIDPVFSQKWKRRKKAAEPSDQVFSLPGDTSSSQAKKEKFAIVKAEPKKTRTFPFTISNLYIKGGRIKLVEALKREPKTFIINNINAHMKNFSYPKLTKFYLDLKGSFKTQQAVLQENINIKGWVDYFNKNMDVSLNLDKIDFFAVGVYCPPNWQPENLKLSEAFLSLDSQLVSESNELKIENSLTLDSIEYAPLSEGEEESPRRKTLKTILALLRGESGKPTFNFIIKTKMDSPKLDLSSVRTIFKKTVPLNPAMILQSVAGEFKQGVEEKLKETKEISVDDTIDAIKQTGEEIVDTFKSIFVPKDEELNLEDNKD